MTAAIKLQSRHAIASSPLYGSAYKQADAEEKEQHISLASISSLRTRRVRPLRLIQAVGAESDED